MKAKRFFELLEEVSIAVCVAGIAVSIFAGIVLREVIKTDFSQNFDLNLIFIYWMCFLGAQAAHRRGLLIRIDILRSAMKAKVQHWMQIFTTIVDTLLLIVVFRFGLQEAISQVGTTLTVIRISRSFLLAALVVSIGSMVVHNLWRLGVFRLFERQLFKRRAVSVEQYSREG